MEEKRLKKLLRDFKSGLIGFDAVLKELKNLPFTDLKFAKVDHHRTLRQGFPEVIYCTGKTINQIEAIAVEILSKGNNLLATRASIQIYDAIKKINSKMTYHDIPKVITCVQKKIKKSNKSPIVIVSAGTADMNVAEEAKIVCEMMGCNVKCFYDVGVAGIHRLFKHLKDLHGASVIIVVAGMDGALASVVGGLTNTPVIAVPTSTGYGSNFEGLSTLLTMLNSCAPNVCVVNINNGFGAGFTASLIQRKTAK